MKSLAVLALAAAITAGGSQPVHAQSLVKFASFLVDTEDVGADGFS